MVAHHNIDSVPRYFEIKRKSNSRKSFVFGNFQTVGSYLLVPCQDPLDLNSFFNVKGMGVIPILSDWYISYFRGQLKVDFRSVRCGKFFTVY